jgi:hypothetical protein
MWIISISLLFLPAPHVFPKFILILIPVIRFCKLDCLVLVTGYVRPLHRILVSFSELVR